jgi:hypothetical protein
MNRCSSCPSFPSKTSMGFKVTEFYAPPFESWLVSLHRLKKATTCTYIMPPFMDVEIIFLKKKIL